MREVLITPDFSGWREVARDLLRRGVRPEEVIWKERGDAQEELPGLFGSSGNSDGRDESRESSTPSAGQDPESELMPPVRVPPEFLEMGKVAAAHRSTRKWSLLYRLLSRLAREDSHLLQMTIDPDVAELDSMVRAVRKDLHKMKAFVRFREVKEEQGSHFIAWHRPDHRIVPLAAPFFARRFANMRWTILTDDLSVSWDGKQLEFLPGCPRSEAPKIDAIEEVWKTYYASTFNPARIKIRMMKKEMAVRYWDTLPETELIRDLIKNSGARLDQFFESQKVSAKKWFPSEPESEWSLPLLENAAKKCRACGICEKATQTVFGEGPVNAEIVFIGEQPGDQEDRAGKPFIGPAGELLDRILHGAGIERHVAYVTNAVKHFKWVPSGEIRLHQKPLSSEVSACRAWLQAEIGMLRPRIVVCLGATAAQAVLGRSIRLEDVRGQFFETAYAAKTFVTTHPAALLRTTDPEVRARDEVRFLNEMRIIAGELASEVKVDADT